MEKISFLCVPYDTPRFFYKFYLKKWLFSVIGHLAKLPCGNTLLWSHISSSLPSCLLIRLESIVWMSRMSDIYGITHQFIGNTTSPIYTYASVYWFFCLFCVFVYTEACTSYCQAYSLICALLCVTALISVQVMRSHLLQ